MLRRTQRDDLEFRGVQIIDDHVQVHLLRVLLSRPDRRAVVRHLLERDALTVVGSNVDPVGLTLDLPAQQRRVEPRQSFGVGTVDDERGGASDSHIRARYVAPAGFVQGRRTQ